MITVVKDEWTPFIKNVRGMNNPLMKIVPRTMRQIIALWVRRAQGITKALGLIKTGWYFDRHKFSYNKIEKRGQEWVGYFGNDAHYAGFLEEGTNAHGPKHAKFLVWRGEKGQLIFAKWVRGIRPYRVWSKALDNTNNLVEQIIDTAIEKQLDKLASRSK